ncbi:unnamed protein product [Urochloa humidicola]
MSSALLRLSARRGSGLRRVVSSAATAAAVPSDGAALAVRRTVSLPPSPLRRLLCSGGRVDQPPMSPHEKVELLQQRVTEIDHQFDEQLIEILKQYKKALQDTDSGFFGSFLSYCGVPKSKYRDGFAQGCELATMFVLSGMVGFMLARVKTLNDI